MVGYFVGPVGLAAVAAAAWSHRFWRVFALGFFGAAGITLGANQLRESGSLDSALPLLALLTGAALIAAGIILRRRHLASVAFMVGAFLVLFAAVGEYGDGNAFLLEKLNWIAFPSALPLIAAAVLARSRMAPLLACLGLFWLAALGTPILDWADQVLYAYVHQIPDLALLGVWALALLLLALFAPRLAVFRLLIYGLVAISVTDIASLLGFALETRLGFDNPSTSAVVYLSRWLNGPVVVAAVWIALSLVLARGKLFEAAVTSDAGSPDIFISYKREERPRVEAIVEALRALKFNVWFDARLASGRSFDDEINQQVRAAKAVLVCWSPGASASEWVRAEATIGRQRGVLCACILEACELTPPFNLVHAEDLSNGALTGANPAWVKLVGQLGELAGRPALGDYITADAAAAQTWLATHAADPLAIAMSNGRKRSSS